MEHIQHNLKEILNKIKSSGYIFLFLDYDGTLVEFKERPEIATPPLRIKNLIAELSLHDTLITTIVSGRTVGNLLEFFKDIDTGRLNWSGVHGAEIKFRNCDIMLSDEAREAGSLVKDLKLQLSKITGDIPCILIEDKKVSLALHYRKCGKKELSRIPGLINVIDDFIKGKPLDYLKMKKVIEVKLKNINKGNSIKLIKEKYSNFKPSITVCIGDDFTDKYLFDANRHGVNIKVGAGGPEGMNAEYYLKDVNEVYNFLSILLAKIFKPL